MRSDGPTARSGRARPFAAHGRAGRLPPAPPGVVNRRFLLRSAGAGLLAGVAGAVLPGCAPPGRTRAAVASATPSPAGPAGGPLHVLTWAGYEGSGVLDGWYRSKDIALTYKSIANENPAAVIKGPGDVDVQLVGLTFFTPQAAHQKVDVGFMVPPEDGAYGFTDCVFIPPHSRHRANALAYANALLGGETAVRMMNSLVQLSTNETVNSRLAPAVRRLFPADLDRYSRQTLKWNKSYYDLTSRYASLQEWNLLWQSVKA